MNKTIFALMVSMMAFQAFAETRVYNQTNENASFYLLNKHEDGTVYLVEKHENVNPNFSVDFEKKGDFIGAARRSSSWQSEGEVGQEFRGLIDAGLSTKDIPDNNKIYFKREYTLTPVSE